MPNVFPTNFPGSKTKIIEDNGTLTTKDGRSLMLSLYNRTGGATGIVPVVTGFSTSQSKEPLVASGSTQVNGTPLHDDWNFFGTVAPGTAAVIPAVQPGQQVQVQNSGASALNVFPPIGFQIDALGANNPYSVPAGKYRLFQCWQTDLIVSSGN